jgi:hypothetical protein
MNSLFSAARYLFSFFQTPSQSSPSTPFTPTYSSVCHARALLKTLNLPTELVLQILEHAQYWPHHTYTTAFDRPKIASAQGGRTSHAVLCLDAAIFSNPVISRMRDCGENPKIKRLDFEVVSRDQGWTSEDTVGTFATSSWLEVSILRRAHGNAAPTPIPRLAHMNWMSNPSGFCTAVFESGWKLVKRPQAAEQGPQDGEGDFAWYLQGNRVAAKHGEYCVTWAVDGWEGNEGAGRGDGFLEELREGDRVLVWARAKVCHELEICERLG